MPQSGLCHHPFQSTTFHATRALGRSGTSLAGFSAWISVTPAVPATCTSTGKIWPHPTWSRLDRLDPGPSAIDAAAASTASPPSPRQPLPGISRTPPPADALVVAADGPESATRRHWNIPVWRHRYRQGCLTSKVALRGSDDVTAFELFRPEGLWQSCPWVTGQRRWCECPHRCEQRAALPGSAFLDQLAAVLPQGLEPDLLLDTPRAFPQQWQLAQRFSRGRGVLVGEAAHRCHPVGGQGLNLCWRDVETLMSIADPGLDARSIARRYGRRRWVDVIAVGMATDLLVRLFSNPSPRSASCGASPWWRWHGCRPCDGSACVP